MSGDSAECPFVRKTRARLNTRLTDLNIYASQPCSENALICRDEAGLRRVPDLPSFMQYAVVGRYLRRL